ncbi:MAG: HEAT repeat domain-containing protein [Pirellulaceae bacterium]|nr:HEAT repeat domain-containing protein [Pirellulaceae bacterium]
MHSRLLIAVLLVATTGCHDGILYQMKRANPYYRAEWKRDQKLGTTFVQRQNELKLLSSSIASMSPEQQAEWSGRLEQLIAHDPSAEMRAEAVRIIAKIPGESTLRALNMASTDKSEKVRLVACQAWRDVGGDAAKDMLLTLVNNSNEGVNVRQTAIESLSAFDSEEVRQTLTRLLDDRNPAIQYHTVQSLRKMTGRDYEGDLQAWKDYMQGQDVPEPAGSIAKTLSDFLPIKR